MVATTEEILNMTHQHRNYLVTRITKATAKEGSSKHSKDDVVRFWQGRIRDYDDGVAGRRR